MIILQGIMGYIFYERHWDNIHKRLEQNLIGEINSILDINRRHSFQESQTIASYMGYTLTKLDSFDTVDKTNFRDKHLRHIKKIVSEITHYDIHVNYSEDKTNILLSVNTPKHSIQLKFTGKKLYSPTTVIFFMWMLGSACFLVVIAILLMKNQIRAILQLADAAEKLGKGQDIGKFKPTGAKEVRIAGKAFLRMKQRIERQIYFRTQLLGHISHDLRTPLTRMRLNTEFINNPEIAQDLNSEISNMESVIEEYLNFAKEEGNESTSQFELITLLKDVVSKYKNDTITLKAPKRSINVNLRKHAIERVLQNVIDNALKFAKSKVELHTYIKGEHWYLNIEDDGKGIPQAYLKKVFQPFFKIDKASKGFGLGLAIVKSIIYSHGGKIKLSKSKLGGLHVIIRVPL